MKVVLLSKGANVPTRADKGAAGYDLYAPVDFIVRPGRNVLPLDFQLELDPGTEAQIRPRSGFSVKGMEGRPVFDPDGEPRRYDADVILGSVDESYRGIVGVIIKSYEDVPFIIKRGCRVAQMVISPYIGVEIEQTDRLTSTDRGAGGFGHTGSH